jgi:hypothetical protein
VESGYMELLDMLGFQHNRKPDITESWIQYYNPTEGRGHNAHNHCRWQPNEETILLKPMEAEKMGQRCLVRGLTPKLALTVLMLHVLNIHAW